MENVIGISINTGESQQTIKGLKDEIKRLQDEILNVEKGTESYNKIVAKLQENQRRLNEVTSLTRKDATALEGSYNYLTHQLSLLNKEYKATTSELKRNELAKQIYDINAQLKEMDASRNVFRRNVGNYTEGVVDAFAQLKQEVKDARNALLQAEEGTDAYADAMKRLSDAQFQLRDMNEQSRYAVADFGEQLSNVVGITQGVVAGFSAFQSVLVLAGADTEEFEKVMVKLQASMALVQGLQGLEGLVDRVKGFSSAISVATKSIGGLSPILLAVSAVVVGIGAMWNKWGESIRKNIPALDEWIKKIDGTTEKEIKALEERQTAWNEYYENITEKANAIKESRELEDITPEAQERIKKLREDIILYEKEVADLDNLKNQNKNNRTIWDEYDAQADKLVNETIPNIKREIQDLLTNPKYKVKPETTTTTTTTTSTTTNANGYKETLSYIKDKEDRLTALKGFISDEKLSLQERLEFQKQINELEVEIEEDKKAEKERLRAEELNAIKQNIEETNNAYDIAIREKQINGENPFDLQIEKIRNQIANIDQLILNTDDADEKEKLMWEKANLELDILEQTNEEKERLREEDEENEKQHQDNLYQLGMASMSAVSDVLNGIADLYESDDEKAQQYAEQIKALRISTAVIDTIQGALGAFMQASATIPPPFGQIIGGIQAGAITAVGMMNIAKIRNTKVGDKNASTDSNFNSSQVTPNASYTQSNPFEYTRNVTTASEYEELNREQRVYILESDLQESNRKVQIRQNETSF